LDLVSGFAEGSKHLLFRVVHEHVAVSEVQDAWLAILARSIPTGTPQLPADLKRDERLAGPGRHRQEHAPLTPEDSGNHLMTASAALRALRSAT
jgi:hypothetical protein